MTPGSRVAGRRTSDGSILANAIPLRYTPSCGIGWEESNLRSFARSISRLQYAHAASPNRTGSCGLEDRTCDLHTHAAMLPPGFEPGSPRRGRGMASVAPQQRCRQPESNRRPTFEGRRCLTALHHDGAAAPRFARGPRLVRVGSWVLDHAAIIRP